MTEHATLAWAPMPPLVDPQRFARPEVLALAAYWRRVRDTLGRGDDAFAERIDERSRALTGVAVEALDVLGRPLSIPTLQDLHVVATRDQTAARAVTADGGFKYVPFPYGRLKDKPNHLLSHGRVVEEFCPPERVVAELQQVLATVDGVPRTMPEVRAAWLVHGVLVTHPFVDGNGRVCRLLASHPFLDHGLPAMWGELSERGTGWKEAVAHAAASHDVGPLTALLVQHQERMVHRLLYEAEGPAADADLDALLRHDARMREARAAWTGHAATATAALPALADIGAEHLGSLGRRLDPEAKVVPLEGAAAVRAAWDTCGESGGLVDRQAPAVALRLDLPGRQTSVHLAVAAVGVSGSGALLGAITVRPRGPAATPCPPTLLVPEEDPSRRRSRFEEWVARGMIHAASNVIRLP